MLGAVMFGHRHFQPVIDAIIQLAEKAAKEPRELNAPDNAALEKEMLGLVEGDLRAAYAIPDKMRAPQGGRCRQGQGDGAFLRRKAWRTATHASSVARRVQGARSQDRALEHPRHRQAHRRPRRQDGAPDRLPRSACCRAPTARRCSPAARRRRWWSPRSAPARTSSASTRCRGPTRRPSCCTTTSRPSRSARPDAWVGPGRREIGHGKLAWRAIHPLLPLHA